MCKLNGLPTSMNRYLLNISYIGTRFKGAQKRINYAYPEKEDLESVQGLLETALLHLKPKVLNKPVVYLSSRTDTGVHAINSAVHVDLENATGKPYCTDRLLLMINGRCHKYSNSLRVLSVKLVSQDFHSRFNAVSRTYLYRLAVANRELKFSRHALFVPLEEIERCYVIGNSAFDINCMKEAALLFMGKHDFRTFRKALSKTTPDKSTKRTISKIEIIHGRPMRISDVYSTPTENIQFYTDYTYWNIIIEAKSFVHHQVRRMIGALVGVAVGKITCSDINVMLQVPSKNSWIPNISPAPSHGLYLCDVKYNPEDLKLDYKVKNKNNSVPILKDHSDLVNNNLK